MKNILILFTILLFLSACQNNSDNTSKNDIAVSSNNYVKEEITPETIVSKTGSFLERYPNGNLKTEGWRNSSEQRDGIWYSYYENGNKWSELSYDKGVKNGVSVVYYPNGKTHYKGQYINDEKSGDWVFYKAKGEIDYTKSY